jgi:hypothetical protein
MDALADDYLGKIACRTSVIWALERSGSDLIIGVRLASSQLRIMHKKEAL